MRRLIASLLVAILMLSHGSMGPAHAHGHDHDIPAASGHHDHHGSADKGHGSVDATEPGKADHGAVTAHNHVIGDQAASAAEVAQQLPTVDPSLPLPRSEPPPSTATVAPPLKPPSA